MKIVLDTNVLISATFWKGESHKILSYCENGKFRLALSEEILQEYKEVLEYKEIKDKIAIKDLDCLNSQAKIRSIAKIFHPTEKEDLIKEDLSDNKILECAKESESSYIITQDKHLLKLKEYKGIKIKTPKDFIEENKDIFITSK